ncbi:MAG: CDP-alcohol phosphatidyltransferase family protein [Muribaculaceae bacterium]|nr:CDP-alcohol phosphatidyltransferase family protein [Muribaculaceae bacterium]
MSTGNTWTRLKAEYKSSLKSSDTEEHIDLCFYRPIGFAWAYLFRKLHVSPNAVTIASIFIGVFAGICMYPTDIWINIAGIVLLIWANSYDSADGQLARLTRQYSQLGRILDGMAGDFWFIAIYVAICLRTVETVPLFESHHWAIWCIAVLAGICHAAQAAVADSYRQFHLLLLKGSAGSELDSTEDLLRRYSELTWKHDFLRKLIQFFYVRYTRNQEAVSPAMQSVLRAMKTRFPDGRLPEQIREQFRAWSFPLCKWENFMTFNWRSIFLFASLLGGQPWLYFVAELTIFNVVLVYTIVRHESICRRMTAVLDT